MSRVPQGFQEALVRQVKDLAELFGPEWSWVRNLPARCRISADDLQIGVGRDDGQERGEYCPIFFKKYGTLAYSLLECCLSFVGLAKA